MDTYAYIFGKNLYINLTNRCSNDCTFCVRNNRKGIDEDELWLSNEPSAEEVIEQIKQFAQDKYCDVVFCGYGESTYRLEEVKKIAAYAHSIGKKTRLDTNGLGKLICGKDIVAEIIGLIDKVSVSLNEKNAVLYDKVSRSVYGEQAFSVMMEFASDCKNAGIEVLMTVVDVIPPSDIEDCRKLCAERGFDFRVREYIA